jgi:CBS-domain-containing membrane protein
VRNKIFPDIIGQQQILELPVSANVREAAKRMTQHHLGSVVVTRDGALVGILTERDLLTDMVAMGRHDQKPRHRHPRRRAARCTAQHDPARLSPSAGGGQWPPDRRAVAPSRLAKSLMWKTNSARR